MSDQSNPPIPAAPRLAPPTLPVRTARLLLRPVLPSDSEAIGGYCRDPDVCRYLPFEPLDDEGLAARMQRLVAGTAPGETGDHLAVAVVEGARVVGDLMLRFQAAIRPGCSPSIAELGWIFDPQARGRGLALESAQALVDIAFTHYPLHRLMAQLDPRNTASARLCERLGMRQEAHTRQDFPEPDGSWSDTAVYGLLRAEWQGARAQRVATRPPAPRS
ncbi:MAG: GNAT family N-acetyltransferase [Nocardioidaceae bacterium]|nr:GNAT family N-acetyltransferase [Nocardioidaceae bacterium]